jgi:hypothetical protein
MRRAMHVRRRGQDEDGSSSSRLSVAVTVDSEAEAGTPIVCFADAADRGRTETTTLDLFYNQFAQPIDWFVIGLIAH